MKRIFLIMIVWISGLQSNAEHYKIIAPVSAGELIDKITILEIKTEKFTDQQKRNHAHNELNALQQTVVDTQLVTPENRQTIHELTDQLRNVNHSLWSIEDKLREKEARKQFDDEFIQLARSVYQTNDERSKIKHEINTLTGSELIEEKQYSEYT